MPINTYVLDFRVGDEMLKKVTTAIAELNELNFTKKTQNKVQFMLNSLGGDLAESEAIIHLINQNKAALILTAFGSIQSAAFNIFFSTKCERIILPSTYGVLHKSRSDITIVEGGKLYSDHDKFHQLFMKKHLPENTDSFLNTLTLTPKELADFRKGKDVYLSPLRLTEILKEQNK